MHLNINFHSKTSLLVLSAVLVALGILNIMVDAPINIVIGGFLITLGFVRLLTWVDVWCFKALMDLRCGPRPERPTPQKIAFDDMHTLLKTMQGYISECGAFATKCQTWRGSDEGRAAFRTLGGIRGYLKARKEHKTCV